MKVLLLNGSRREKGCTYTALSIVAEALGKHGIDTEICFEKGKRYNGFYDTPYGTVEMEVLTNELTNTVNAADGGVVDIDYNISLKGLTEGRSRLNIEVSQ